uniref:Uncharacterized protein n=1 Tax=Tetranychus urticae TaxID=32264 RepID=T1KLW2_TETUR
MSSALLSMFLGGGSGGVGSGGNYNWLDEVNAVDSKLLGNEPPFLQAGGKCSSCFRNQISGDVGLISSNEVDEGSLTLDELRENETFDREGDVNGDEENVVVDEVWLELQVDEGVEW